MKKYFLKFNKKDGQKIFISFDFLNVPCDSIEEINDYTVRFISPIPFINDLVIKKLLSEKEFYELDFNNPVTILENTVVEENSKEVVLFQEYPFKLGKELEIEKEQIKVISYDIGLSNKVTHRFFEIPEDIISELLEKGKKHSIFTYSFIFEDNNELTRHLKLILSKCNGDFKKDSKTKLGKYGYTPVFRKSYRINGSEKEIFTKTISRGIGDFFDSEAIMFFFKSILEDQNLTPLFIKYLSNPLIANIMFAENYAFKYLVISLNSNNFQKENKDKFLNSINEILNGKYLKLEDKLFNTAYFANIINEFYNSFYKKNNPMEEKIQILMEKTRIVGKEHKKLIRNEEARIKRSNEKEQREFYDEINRRYESIDDEFESDPWAKKYDDNSEQEKHI